jgi:hypothetical protein
MSESPWKRGWRNWSGRGWFVRSVCLPPIGFGIGFLLGPRLMAQYPAWVPGLIGAVGAPFVWGLLTLVISLLKSPAETLAERDVELEIAKARIRELEDMRPRLSGCLNNQGNRLYLKVHNEGAPADVWAKVSSIGDITRTLDNVDAVWRNELEARVRIGTGGDSEIIIAEMGRHGSHEQRTSGEIVGDLIQGSDVLFYWFIPYISGGHRDSARSSQGGVPSVSGVYDARQDGEARAVRQRLTIKIFSDLPSSLPPIACEITLVGCDQYENLSGVPLCPALPLDPSEVWQSFRSAADHMLAMFRGVRDWHSSPILPVDWRGFQSSVQDASSLAESLAEPYKAQAQALIRPFIGIEQSNLSAISGAADELQEWLESTNQNILTERWQSPSEGPPSSTPSG